MDIPTAFCRDLVTKNGERAAHALKFEFKIPTKSALMRESRHFFLLQDLCKTLYVLCRPCQLVCHTRLEHVLPQFSLPAFFFILYEKPATRCLSAICLNEEYYFFHQSRILSAFSHRALLWAGVALKWSLMPETVYWNSHTQKNTHIIGG